MVKSAGSNALIAKYATHVSATNLTIVFAASKRVRNENSRLNPFTGFIRWRSGLIGKPVNVGPDWIKLLMTAAIAATAKNGAIMLSIRINGEDSHGNAV